MFLVIPFLLDFFQEQNITNYHGFGIFYRETETGMSFGYNLLDLDILFVMILASFFIWILWDLKKTKLHKTQ